MSDRDLEGRIALVTGAAGGIGKAVLATLRASGAVAIGWDITVSDSDTDVRAVDVTDAAAVERGIDAIELSVGELDILVNVAGVLHTARVADTTDSDWHRLFAVNSEGVFIVSRAVTRRMEPRRRGAIVTVSSNAGEVPRIALAAYAASKAAATMFTRCLGLELAHAGIRCNVVAPGSTRTPMLGALLGSEGGESEALHGSGAKFRTGIPLGRIAEPEDIAETVAYLVSDRARHITMSTLLVDGGASLHA